MVPFFSEKTHQRVLHQISGLRYIYQTGIFFVCMGHPLPGGSTPPKARLWSQSRKDLWQKLENLPTHGAKRFGCIVRRPGEFEARPPGHGSPQTTASAGTHRPQQFFSPSGYEIRKKLCGCRCRVFTCRPICLGQLPVFTTPWKPDLGLIIKYEFWQGYLHEAHRRGLPLFLVSGIF